MSGCPAYVENWGRNTVTNSLSNLVAVTEKRACKAAPKNRREWDSHQNWPSCMPYLEVSKSINLHDNKTNTYVSILPLEPKTSILYEHILGTHWWLITASSMAATAAVLIFHKKCLDAFASDSSLILKKFITGWIGFLRDATPATSSSSSSPTGGIILFSAARVGGRVWWVQKDCPLPADQQW